jgi:hypothetical protein
VAHTLVTKSPLHARHEHPRLNPNFERKDDPKYDFGTATHAAILEGDDIVYVCQYENWRTNESKEARELARSHGKVPLLAKDYERLQELLAAARDQIAGHKIAPQILKGGKPEQTLAWEDLGVRCRARLDWLTDDYTLIQDVKTTGRSANPEDFERNLYKLGYDLKAVMYMRAVKAITGVEPIFQWILIEAVEPYALTVITPKPAVLASGESKVERALAKWRECLRTGRWPSYSDEVCYVDLPPWEAAREEQANYIEEAA